MTDGDLVGAPSPKLDLPTSTVPYAEFTVLKVGGGTSCKNLALSIVGVLDREKRRPIMEFVGAGAGNQAIKAVAIANSLLSTSGRFLSATPIFVQREFKDSDKVTAIQLHLVCHAYE